MIENNKLESEIQNFHFFLKNVWKGKKAIYKLFRTDLNGYLFDTGTNKIFKCENIEYNLLENLAVMDIDKAIYKTKFNCHENGFKKALNEIRRKIEDEKILLGESADQFGMGIHYHDLENHLNNELGMIQLEVTERCNLRCSYCIYNPSYKEKRNHGTKDMSLEIAYHAVDYLASHSKDKVAVTFYGGEPLLRFPFIKSVVNYAKKKIKNKELTFSITTNAVLLTKEIAEFFYEENFGVLVSLDGPKDIHDAHRKNLKGQGSFESTLSGFEKLCDAFGADTKRLGFSMVYAPPYSKNKVERVSELWREVNWIPKDISINITYPALGTAGNISRELYSKIDEREIDLSLYYSTRNRFLNDYKEKVKSHPIVNAVCEKRLATLFQRPILNRIRREHYLNGCCLPGVRKIYVQVNGNFALCERIGNAPVLGNVFTGIDINTIKQHYISEYEKKSIPQCADCWAINMCNICYINAFYNGRIDMDMKNYNCNMKLLSLEKDLILLCRLLEIDENGLDYLYDWEFE